MHTKGSSLSLPAHGWVGARATSSLAAHFAKQNTKFGDGKKLESESEGGQKFLPPNPLPFCPPERKLSEISVRIFAEKSSDFVQDRFYKFGNCFVHPFNMFYFVFYRYIFNKPGRCLNTKSSGLGN
ncbi:MAG: hypothetical protein UV70_C0026G0006 [Parcubacteria group bacterium GW2011_GWA2_43_13]|nr:MAG: hypothetical protein UV70_C0026G0006 [Parcubacteria group bacterium GW2011_GWA2_43_13]